MGFYVWGKSKTAGWSGLFNINKAQAPSRCRSPSPVSHRMEDPPKWEDKRDPWPRLAEGLGFLRSAINETPNAQLLLSAIKKELIRLGMAGLTPWIVFGGAERDRTVDLMTASHALSQLSYSPVNLKKYLYHLLLFYVNNFFSPCFFLTETTPFVNSFQKAPEWWNW